LPFEERQNDEDGSDVDREPSQERGRIVVKLSRGRLVEHPDVPRQATNWRHQPYGRNETHEHHHEQIQNDDELAYTGLPPTPVEYGKDLGIEFERSDIEQPVVDLTPSLAVSSFIISDSDQFPEWKGDYLVGSLKARSLFRVEIEDNHFVARETLFEGIGRLRDIEQASNGDIYLLFEHNAGGKIARLVPVE